jgi:hypothetical protein
MSEIAIQEQMNGMGWKGTMAEISRMRLFLKILLNTVHEWQMGMGNTVHGSHE